MTYATWDTYRPPSDCTNMGAVFRERPPYMRAPRGSSFQRHLDVAHAWGWDLVAVNPDGSMIFRSAPVWKRFFRALTT